MGTVLALRITLLLFQVDTVVHRVNSPLPWSSALAGNSFQTKALSPGRFLPRVWQLVLTVGFRILAYIALWYRSRPSGERAY